ncbi:PRD domain-containing protein [Xylocopilactobacillus apicola]|uniref:Transcriptional antiterminator n=1 Tax=Xylocopilactobacillus apicola TaxID=2932184 RepID=A0AAU9CYJ5_9LACO|nr:PRD domain-containing protein [Xylocopilactobacillus apicola]BDR59077.1 transcriptional antiterminator [Xylocopilactobacillus apicola]
MKVKRRINNNVVLASEISGNLEGVLIGKGIGFGVHPDDPIDKQNVQTMYLPSGHRNLKQMASELGEANEDDVNLTYEVTKFIEQQVGEKSGEGLFFGLLDHLVFTLQRYEKKLEIKSPLDWEIRNFYPDIYRVGLAVVDLINSKRKIKLPKSEAAFISLHIINNIENISSIDTTVDLLKVSKDVNSLIRISSDKEIDLQSISYQRFIDHLRYFVLRLVSDEVAPAVTTNESLMKMIIDQYPDEYQISKKIGDYLAKRFHSKVSEDEYLYLTLHLARLLNV